MEKKLDSNTVSLSKLFSQEFFFRVPEYQRPFLWDKDNFSDLIDDLIDAPRDRPYFLGTLVLHQQGNSNYDIVDGQQRLTAMCLLLACIRDSPALSAEGNLRTEIHEKIIQPARELDGIPEKNRVQVKEQALFHAVVGEFGGTTQPVSLAPRPSPSEERYELARSVFTDRIADLTTEQVKDLSLFIARDCSLICLATDSFDSAFRLFTIVNDRGKQLRRIDVLKAINLDPEVVTSETSRSMYAQKWEEMESRLGESNFEEIFHLLRLIYTKDKPSSGFAHRVHQPHLR